MRQRGRAAPAAPLADLGEHPDGGPVQVLSGRVGPYVKWGKVNATIPKSMSPDSITVEDAVALIAEREGRPAKAPAKKAAAKKPAAKKTPAKAPAKAAAKPKAAPAKARAKS